MLALPPRGRKAELVFHDCRSRKVGLGFAAPATTRRCKRRFPNRFPKLECGAPSSRGSDEGREQAGRLCRCASLRDREQISISGFGFKDDDDARRLGFVTPQTRQTRIAPARKTDNFTS